MLQNHLGSLSLFPLVYAKILTDSKRACLETPDRVSGGHDSFELDILNPNERSSVSRIVTEFLQCPLLLEIYSDI